MIKIFKAKSVDEAKQLASKEFGTDIANISFNVIKEAKKGFLGLGSTDAEIEAIYEVKAVDTEPVKNIDDVKEIVEEKSTIIENVADEKSSDTVIENIVDEKSNDTVTEKISDEENEYSIDNFTLVENENDLNPKAKVAVDYINSVFSAMNIELKTVVYQNETGAIIDIISESNGTIIGRRGETLDAIQYLSSMIANKGDREYFRITVDCFGYREKRKATLKQLANKVAKNVLKTNRSQTLEPMNPYERRIIHATVTEIEGVLSRSVGDEPYRKIIIYSENAKRRSNNDRNRRNNNRNNKPKKTYSEPRNIDLSTSFEKEYKKPKPEDSIEGGLYGKIEF